jgi:hypothetical protein
MGYLHIQNLYKAQEILLFRECYALEKIHGTSAHIGWDIDRGMHFFSGGTSHNIFTGIFNEDHQAHMETMFKDMGCQKIKVHGESYGGKMQGMSHTYGKENRFVVFDVKINDLWLNVPAAEQIAKDLHLDFVPYVKCLTDIEILTAIRMSPSEQAIKCGITEPKKREGIVLRPLIELHKNNGKRIIAKYKNDEFIETKTKREIDPSKLVVLEEAKAIAEEWVTEMRLTHVLQQFPDFKMEQTGDIIKTMVIIKAMVQDIEREGQNEITMSKDARKEIGKATVQMLKKRLQATKKALP